MRNARILWDYHDTGTPLAPADAIIGLGSYDLRVADRCAELFHSGLAPRIVFSGASGNWTGGLYATSEAQAFADRAIALGVAGSVISVEPNSTNIAENIGFVRALLPEAGRLIWVTKPQTRRRVSATLRVVWPKAHSMIAAPEHDLAAQPTEHHRFDALVSEMVGDVWRMAAYARKGFQASQPMPPAVRTAFDALVAAGFTHHLPDNMRSLDP
ncbi:YdcF family protein [Hoeflea ulvae]|uniref:YdcF family protein n=1 Tax=Hoeflea ulvae TaxID=2983764 RepID=A0ABT3YFW5_9HYPH|nr:YdcF family protein [Hoeflea ulvae]MCY0094679.1 YdcF family protein [Hoeflea ulvae]